MQTSAQRIAIRTQVIQGSPGLQGIVGATGATGATGAAGSNGQTICHYTFPITAETNRANLPSPFIGTPAIPFGWNTFRNSNTYPSYIAWNHASHLESTKLYVSWVEKTGVNIHKFLSMLRINDVVTIQSKTNHRIVQEWILNAPPVPHDNYIEFGVELANPASLAITDPSAILIFAYHGAALTSALEHRITALEESVASLLAQLPRQGV
jgi:hypothetical protein